MDECDTASEREELARNARISLCEREASKPIPTSLFCLNCGDDTENGVRWCCFECAKDWEKMQ